MTTRLEAAPCLPISDSIGSWFVHHDERCELWLLTSLDQRGLSLARLFSLSTLQFWGLRVSIHALCASMAGQPSVRSLSRV